MSGDCIGENFERSCLGGRYSRRIVWGWHIRKRNVNRRLVRSEKCLGGIEECPG